MTFPGGETGRIKCPVLKSTVTSIQLIHLLLRTMFKVIIRVGFYFIEKINQRNILYTGLYAYLILAFIWPTI